MNLYDLDLSTVTRGELLHAGKANNVFATNSPFLLELEATDRISAGNGAKKSEVESKGKANNLISTTVFAQLEREQLVPTHYVGPGNNECSKFVLKTEPILLEVIGRFKATGSFIKRYGVKDMTEFDELYTEYTFKSDAAGDPPISKEAIVALKMLSLREVGYIDYLTERIGLFLRNFFAQCDGNLIDFKVEFGRLPQGQIILIDEISLDTCRIRDRKTGQSFDKDRFRKDLGDVAGAYSEMAKRVQQTL